MKKLTRYPLDNILASNIVGKKIATFRNQKHLTQEQLAQEITLVLNLPKKFLFTNISLYESGHRMPPVPILIALSIIFGVSLDELVGFDRPMMNLPANEDSPLPEFDFLISPSRYKLYDQQPVYIVSATNNFESQWGILDIGQNQVVTSSMLIPLSASVKVHRYKPLDATFVDLPSQTALDLKGLMQTKLFWVEKIDGDRAMKALYKGWYKHNEQHTCIIGIKTGLTLPYEGLGLSYNAFNLKKNN